MMDAGLIDRVAGFVAPVLLGGKDAPTAISGTGMNLVQDSLKLRDVGWTPLGKDLLVEGYLWKPSDVVS